jgi:hypothetical protein
MISLSSTAINNFVDHFNNHRQHYWHDDHPVMLDEENYKGLMKDVMGNNVPGAIMHSLPYRDWAPLLRSVHFVDREEGTLKFFVRNRYNGWFNYWKFDDWRQMVIDPDVTCPEAARLLLWGGNLRFHCPCPAFKFFGMQYILTRKDSAILPETRFPRIKNPQLKGVLCKHGIRSSKTLAFHLGTMAKYIKIDRLAEIEKDETD